MSGERVCYLLDRYVVLSQTFVREEIAELRRQGGVVDVVALEPGDVAPASDEPVRYLPDFSLGTLRTGAAHVRLLVRRPGAWLRLWRRRRSMAAEGVNWRLLPVVAEALAREQVRSLHAHFAWGGALAAAELSRLLSRPWSVTVHARDLYVGSPEALDRLRSAAVVVTVCEHNRRWIRERLPDLAPPVVIVCGVHLPATVRAGSSELDVIAVGRLVSKKGFDVLVRAAALLLPDHPRLRVEIVGAGPEHEGLHGAIVDHGLEDHVRLSGALDHTATLERIAAASVFCLPARVAADGDHDSMPVVVKEAMARAVPVVTTPVGGIPEMVDAGCGRLVPPDDPAALAGAIDELLRDPALASALGDAGRRRVAERFTLAGEVAKLRGVLEGLHRNGGA